MDQDQNPRLERYSRQQRRPAISGYLAGTAALDVSHTPSRGLAPGRGPCSRRLMRHLLHITPMRCARLIS